MQEDILGPLKELTGEKKVRYTQCDRCGKTLLKDEARTGAARGVDEHEALCGSCYEDFMRGELLPVEEEDER